MAAFRNFLTTTITQLELFCFEQSIGKATGFFVEWNTQWYLASNWHVLSGRDPSTGQPRHSSGAVPDTCVYLTFEIHGEKLVAVRRKIELGDALNKSARWLQHPAGQSIDIGVIPLGQTPVGTAKSIYDPSGYDADMYIDLGDDLFLPGYPLGLSAPGMLPIWKRASLASSLEFGDNSYCYVDTATRDGMSGAPCLAISNSSHFRLDRHSNKMQRINQPGYCRLIGIYSGRRNPSDGFEAQIGIVWREHLLRDILLNGVLANVRLT